jgi:ligand-binding sensor domain-containing protein
MANRLFILLLFPFSIYAQDLALGEWKYHLSFESNVQITENEDRFFVATESGLFTLDKQSNELNTFDQTNVLSDIGVSHLHYDQETGILFIGYTNGNIDLVADGITQNLVDIKQSSSISGSRQINDVLTHEGFFYVATGYGISVIDPDRFEVKETVFMGELGTESQVHQIAKLADTLFAATNRGLFYTTFENPLFTNIEAWSRYTDFPDGESDGPINQVVTMNGELFANYHNATINDGDIIYRRDEGFGPQYDPTSG